MLLKAGPINVLYDNGFLRYFKVGDVEALRMIYFAVRDQDWNTCPFSIENEHIDQNENYFKISYKAVIDFNDIKINWQVDISGLADGTVTFSIDGTAQNSFWKNRMGLCILHPIKDLAGNDCRVEHSDGSSATYKFPEIISPHQPFIDIKSMQWLMPQKLDFTLNFEGEIFEIEDQRNWTDDSYKTYCTPLNLPFPAFVQQGESFKQKVIFNINIPEFISGSGESESIVLHQKGGALPFPLIGLGINSELKELKSEEVSFLKSAGFNHLRADIFLNKPDWQEKSYKVFEQSNLLELPVELALFFGEKPLEELSSFLDMFKKHPVNIFSVSIFEFSIRFTTDDLLQIVGPEIRKSFPLSLLGGGSDANFAEFNRNRFSYDNLDFVVFATNPQVHATDDLTIIENAGGQGYAVQSARFITGKEKIQVSPVTLKRRFNAVAASTSQNESKHPADPRQNTYFTAAWTLGSIKNLAEAGVSLLTYFETTGSRGICSGEEVFPVGHLLHHILPFKPDSILPLQCNEPLKVSAMLLQKGDTKRLILGNHTAVKQTIILPEGFFVQSISVMDTDGNIHDGFINKDGKSVDLPFEKCIIIDGE